MYERIKQGLKIHPEESKRLKKTKSNEDTILTRTKEIKDKNDIYFHTKEIQDKKKQMLNINYAGM